MLNKADDSIKLISMSTANRKMTRSAHVAKFNDINERHRRQFCSYYVNTIIFILNIPKENARTVKVKTGNSSCLGVSNFFISFIFIILLSVEEIEVHSNRNNSL